MKLKNYFLLLSIISLVFFSCQKEINTVVQPQQNEILAKNSVTATLAKNTVTHDGSKDNIIDHASCLSVQLPVTVIANGLEITINSENDYQEIEDVFDQFDFDVDNLEIIFPITIILSDYSEVVINNMDELTAYVNSCAGENEPDDDIECIDFIYPITFSIFDSANELTDTITVENDEQFYLFLEDMNESDIVQINFPISVQLADGTEKTIENIDQLEHAIEEAQNSCNEDDNNDYNDDDCIDCSVSLITEVLQSCSWMPDTVKINGEDNSDQYANYIFTFHNDGTVTANDNGNELQGTWSVEEGETQIIVTIHFDDLTDFSYSWKLHEIDNDNTEVDLLLDNNKLKLEKVCVEDKTNFENALIEGTWLVAKFNNEGTDETANYNDFVLNFMEDGSVAATKNNDVVNGTWQVNYDSGHLKLYLDFGDATPFDQLNEDWLSVDIQTTRVEVNHFDETTNTESNLVFERM
ncbi:MAG: hypothetical protein ACWA42_06750 [Lutibacter sp.]